MCVYIPPLSLSWHNPYIQIHTHVHTHTFIYIYITASYLAAKPLQSFFEFPSPLFPPPSPRPSSDPSPPFPPRFSASALLPKNPASGSWRAIFPVVPPPPSPQHPMCCSVLQCVAVCCSALYCHRLSPTPHHAFSSPPCCCAQSLVTERLSPLPRSPLPRHPASSPPPPCCFGPLGMGH